LITPGETLSQKVVKGGFWVFFLKMVNRGFSLIRLIVLARILSPNDFGLMGIALLTMSSLETFSQTGFQQALIQKKEDIESYLNSAWTVLIFRGFILFIILYFIAPYAAIFFDTPEAKSIIRVIGFSILFQAFTNIGVIYFQKELKFNREFIYQFSGTLADFIVSILAVLILKNVWALALGLLAGNITRFCVSYLIHPCRPRLSFTLGKVKELFGFGKWILGSSIVFFLITQGDDIFVGKLLGTTALGFYQLAYRISNIPATEITHVISQVTFPAYSKLQENIPKLREAYLKILQLTAFLSFPVAGLIFILSPDFTKIFLGEKWIPMVPAMQVLTLYGGIRAIGATTGPLFQGVGRPGICVKLAVIQLLMMIVIIYPFTNKFGIFGTAIAIVVPSLITQIISVIKVWNIIKCEGYKLIKPLLFPFISISIVILSLHIFISVQKNINIIIFIILLIFSGVTYLGITYLFNKIFSYDNVEMLVKFLRQKGNN